MIIQNDVPWKSKTLLSIELSETCTSPNASQCSECFLPNQSPTRFSHANQIPYTLIKHFLLVLHNNNKSYIQTRKINQIQKFSSIYLPV